jgi:hypothetical protein
MSAFGKKARIPIPAREGAILKVQNDNVRKPVLGGSDQKHGANSEVNRMGNATGKMTER